MSLKYLGLRLFITILCVVFKIIRLDYKTIPYTLLITFIIYTFIHIINVCLNQYFINNNILDWAGNIIQVNYMFSFIPDNPVLELFYNIIPYKYFYMLLVFPVIIFYLACIYIPNQARRNYKLKKATY